MISVHQSKCSNLIEQNTVSKTEHHLGSTNPFAMQLYLQRKSHLEVERTKFWQVFFLFYFLMVTVIFITIARQWARFQLRTLELSSQYPQMIFKKTFKPQKEKLYPCQDSLWEKNLFLQKPFYTFYLCWFLMKSKHEVKDYFNSASSNSFNYFFIYFPYSEKVEVMKKLGSFLPDITSKSL